LDVVLFTKFSMGRFQCAGTMLIILQIVGKTQIQYFC
jgi:hypothetical protein